MGEERKSFYKRVLDTIDVNRPGYFLLWVLGVSLVIYSIGLFLLFSSSLSYLYAFLFPVSSGILYMRGIYYTKTSRSLKLYLGSILIVYSLLVILGSIPGRYLLISSPSAVQSFANSIQSVRQTYTTELSLSSEIFLNNIKIDLLSYIPVVGGFIFGYTMVNTASYVWALSLSYYQAHITLWFVGLLAVLIAPDTFTELSSYIIAVIGGFYLFKAITNKSTIGNYSSNHGYIIKSLLLLVSSVGLLYASALLEAFLILKLGL